MFERILVAFDGSESSRGACRVALEIAARFGSSVTVAVVHPPSDEPTDGRLELLVPVNPEGKTLAQMIEEMQKEAKSRKIPSLEPAFLQGDVVPTLLEYLRAHPQDLAVTGSRGLSRGRRLLLGSVSSALVDSAPCPVLVVRPDSSKSSGTGTRPAAPRPRSAR